MSNVNHPSHYTDGKIEVIEFIEDKNLDFCTGNAVKYICRAGKKDPKKTIEDFEKAIWYINRKIGQLKKNTIHKTHKVANLILPNPLQKHYIPKPKKRKVKNSIKLK